MDMFGEIGVFFNIPQPFTVRSRKLSQVVRISHNRFKQLVQQLDADKKTIMSNFTQYLKDLKKEVQEEMPFLTELLLDLNIEQPTQLNESENHAASNYGQEGREEKKFGKRGTTILMADGFQVEDLNALRENDHLFIS
ncbi:hypothetical protein R6Q59_011045 [Mikania micrantha]